MLDFGLIGLSKIFHLQSLDSLRRKSDANCDDLLINITFL